MQGVLSLTRTSALLSNALKSPATLGRSRVGTLLSTFTRQSAKPSPLKDTQQKMFLSYRRSRPAGRSGGEPSPAILESTGDAVATTGSSAASSGAKSLTGTKLAVTVCAGLGAISVGLLGGKVFEGMSKAGTLHDNSLWPQYVRDRVANSFTAFGFGVAATAVSATMLFRMGAATIFMTRPLLSFIGSIALMMGARAVVAAVPNDNLVLKYAGLSVFNFAVGLAICPMVGLGGALLARAAMITGGIVGSLALVAMNSPSDTYLSMGAPLAMGLGGIFIANIASVLVPSVAAASLLYNISMYGGLVLFSGFCLYDTSKMVERAKRLPEGAYDPVNESLSIFMDAVNIFIRIAYILAGSSKRK